MSDWVATSRERGLEQAEQWLRRSLPAYESSGVAVALKKVASGLRRGVAAQQLTADQGWMALERWRRLGVTRYPAVGLLDRVWELRGNLSAYDATYVALAEMLGCGLLTADARLSRAPGVRGPITVVPR